MGKFVNIEQRLKELQEAVAFAVENDLELKVHSVKIIPISTETGEDTLEVEVILSLSKRRMPKDIMYSLVQSAMRTIRDSGEQRYPVILPHIARNQLLREHA